MLDLDARVHLEEVELPAGTVEEELHRPEPSVPQLAGQSGGRCAQAAADVIVQVRRRRLLEQLLVATLHRAVAVTEVNDPVAVSEDLDLDVASGDYVPLDIHTRVPESSIGLGHRQLKISLEIFLRIDAFHSPATAATDCLDQQRVAHPFSDLESIRRGPCLPSGDHWQSCRHRVVAGAELVTHGFKHRDAGTHERHTEPLARSRQVGVLRQEAIPRV